jgi:hypothetical protein
MQQRWFINNFNQLDMFRAIVLVLPAGDMSPAGSIVGALYHKL